MIRRLLVLLALLMAIAGLSAAAQPAYPEPTVYAITGAKIVLEPGKEIPTGTLVIRKGVIEAVGPDVKPPADATIIEGKDLVIYPGFIDAGNSWGIDLAVRRNEAGPPEPFDYTSGPLAATKADNRKG